ncbi:unnamed protein product [Rotaria socialis]|uniref:Uncharacterized protein n=1 Tax=Rotaria socialis TaxID=392032 RepID=A0A821D4V4_9BILA|nr:unnamed protein product [Rotaria socialis]
MASDTAETETLLQGSIIAVSDTPSSTDESPATKALKKTARDQFYTDIKMTNETKSWEATCKICKSKIRGTKGVTSNYNRHAKDFHPSEYESWQEQLQSISLTVELQKSIVENLIIEFGLPLSLIERSGFITFMYNVDPKFSTISRRTLTRTIFPHLYTKMLHGLKSFYSMATFISLTLDLWTDRRQRVFFALTGHSIINSEFKSYVLSFQPIYGKNRAPVLLDTYEACISSFSIRGKLVRLITDSASNNIAAFSGLIIPGFECYFQRDDDDELYSDWYNDGEQTESDDAKIDNNVPLDVQDVVKQFLDPIAVDDESFRLPCYAHSIQLVIKDGLKVSTCVEPSLKKISKIAKLSHSSTAVKERLENIQVCVPNANKTRWNSQYDMVGTVIDYQMLNEFVSLLTLFAEATTTTHAQHVPSISIVAPSILAIYQDLLLERANVKHASSLCGCLLESLLSRFGVNAPLGTSENDNPMLSPIAQTQLLSASAAASPITPK